MSDDDEHQQQQPEYEPEEVLNMRVDPVTKLVYYYVSWLGFGVDENTWELEQDLIDDGHQHVIDEYKMREVNRLASDVKISGGGSSPAASSSRRGRTPEPPTRSAASPSSSRRSTPSKSTRVLALLRQQEGDGEQQVDESPRRDAVKPAVVDVAERRATTAPAPLRHRLRPSWWLVLVLVVLAALEHSFALWWPLAQVHAEQLLFKLTGEGGQVLVVLDEAQLLAGARLVQHVLAVLLVSHNYPLSKGVAVVGAGLGLAAVADVQHATVGDASALAAYLALTLAVDKLVEQQTVQAVGNVLACGLLLAGEYNWGGGEMMAVGGSALLVGSSLWL